jgi:hypothetical protein
MARRQSRLEASLAKLAEPALRAGLKSSDPLPKGSA